MPKRAVCLHRVNASTPATADGVFLEPQVLVKRLPSNSVTGTMRELNPIVGGPAQRIAYEVVDPAFGT